MTNASRKARTSSALLITLLTMGLMTIIVVAFLGTMSSEVSSSRRDLDNQRARAMATLAMNNAVAQLRQGLGVWDNPFNMISNAPPPTYYWSISPGILTRWSYSQIAPQSNYPLFSIDPNGATNLINLNAPQADGSYPIAGETNSPNTNAPNISVYWANVLQNPSVAASAANPLVGRYAYWVDDENAKININTADGTLKYTTNSLGLGTPSEVSLQVLQQGGANLTTTVATNIVSVARNTGFNSPREILRASGTTPDLYTNNNFYLTTFGRSPELNIFGEPKIYMISASPCFDTNGSGLSHGRLDTNNVTGQALTEIYPTPSQLPALSYGNLSYGLSGSFQAPTNQWMPLVFSSEWTMEDDAGSVHGYQGDREGWMLDLISEYFGGRNSANQVITWPMFPGASGTSLTNKYSLRQLDCLSAQIVDLGGKTIFPEANCVSSAGGDNNMPYTVPSTPLGPLSREIVVGLARSAKINEVYIIAKTTGAMNTAAPTVANPYVPPKFYMQVYLETYLPAGYAGVDLLNMNNGLPPAPSTAGLPQFGENIGCYSGLLNMLDLVTPSATNNTAPAAPLYLTNYATMYYEAGYNVIGNVGTSLHPTNFLANNYWADVILRNDQGIDFAGSPSGSYDLDTNRAKIYHPYLTNQPYYTNTGVALGGAGPFSTNYAPILEMANLSTTAGANAPGNVAWLPGQYRMAGNLYGISGSPVGYDMWTNANSTAQTNHINGGIVVTGECRNGYECDPDPTPLDAGVRGNPRPLTNTAADSFDLENVTNLVWTWQAAVPGQTSVGFNAGETLHDHVINGSIPVSFSIAIPPGSTGTLNTNAGGVTTYDAAVADPLVNKFPGDWVVSVNPLNGPTMGGLSPPALTTATYGNWNYYYGSSGANLITGGYYDPDSFWLPTLDPKIPRTARFSNIGYLNYLRTGIIPDNETGAIQNQSGTPYRCLNFSPAYDTSQTISSVISGLGVGYPDWAILDLFTIPSTLLPYGGPYGYYSYNTSSGVSTWTPGTIMTGNPTNMYYYGTWGGSTPGRINPNGAVVYTTNVYTPTPGITRTLPLQALLHGLTNNATIASGQSASTATVNAPTFTGGALVNDSGTALSIASYLRTNLNGIGGNTPAPFREPAEICDVLSGFSATSSGVGGDSGHSNPTRNDLVRQIVGNLTTQSNVFSIWVAGQTITKSKTNLNSDASSGNYGTYESGDQITASVRYHYIVERYLQGGAGGVDGNTQDPAPHFSTLGTNAYPKSPVGIVLTNATGDVDGIVGTYDDPVDPVYHPANPRYLYRVVYAEEIRD